MRLPCDLRKGALKERRIPWTVEMPLATHESGTGCGFSMWPYAQAGKDGAALMDTTMATWESTISNDECGEERAEEFLVGV